MWHLFVGWFYLGIIMTELEMDQPVLLALSNGMIWMNIHTEPTEQQTVEQRV